ncbi:ABC transporter substrate-binding protein [Terrabacter sp. MAHUQ-38]|uniref:ABC transporter substrate-binding protein n=1 Tax=unclassified Terrabacter TaxID=2630222 RepID=UPI00165E6D7A|nr:ABC transporter substrate-binding protein [Terrabacter sp. MAHUQ-38]MBC9824173.1 ABC transporter substrate-binding protein [Terrabacter sp. MAHUQ-38]
MARSAVSRRAALALAVTTAASVALGACTSGNASGTAAGAATKGALLTIPREDMGTFTRNFNPFSPNALPMTQQAIYERMFIYNPVKGEAVPWLAQTWETSKDGRTVTFHLNPAARWSDGKPLTAEDVAYTFSLQKKVMGGFDYLASAKAADAQTVQFTLSKPFSPALYELGQQVIVPKHVWEKVKDPAKETNPTPVGSGPYTTVAAFTPQSFDLTKNPNYWQAGKQNIPGIRMLAFAGNDPANLATTNGETDWADQFVPNIEKTFVAKDPAHRHYWFPPVGSTIHWQLNTTKAPYDDVRVRKALSTAVNRDQVVKVGMSGYAQPADCTGLSGGYNTWRDESVAGACSWTKFDVAAANAALDAAGLPKGGDGFRTLTDGKPWEVRISVGSASSDWLSVANVIAQNLAAVGVKARVDSKDWAVVVAGYEDGSFDTGIVWSNGGPTPYQYYRGVMSTETVKKAGEKATENYHRFGDAAADKALAAFAATSDESAQKQAASQLQRIYDETAPVVPLFSGPEWGLYNDVRFTGFPTQDNPYATLLTRGNTAVLVLTTVKPRA